MLLLHSLLTCADAGPDLCTFCPDLCTLRLWCYPSINQRKGGHWLQLALVTFICQPLAQTLLALVRLSNLHCGVVVCGGCNCIVSGGGGCSYWGGGLNGSSQN